MPTLTLSSAELVYRTEGVGDPTVVLVHGLACSAADWAHQLEELGRETRVVALDQRCHGASTGRGEECTIAALADDLVALLEELRGGPAVLVGHSLGCRVCIEASLRAPELAAGVVLVDGNLFGGAGVTADGILELLRSRGHAAVVAELFAQMFVPGSPAAARERLLAGAQTAPPELVEAVLLSNLAWEREQLIPALERIAAPVTAVQSTTTDEAQRRRPLRPHESTPWLDLLERHVAELEVVKVADAGHFPMLDQPVQTTEAIRRLVRAVADRPEIIH